MPRPARLPVLVVVAALTAGLASCSSSVAMEPADAADDPACADVTVRLPADVDGQPRRWTDAQATGAWGDPAAVLLTCGIAPPGPTTDRCITIGGVDWLVDESESPRFRLTTYGRTPAVEVYLDNEVVSPNEVLDAVSIAVGTLPQTGACTDPEGLEPDA
ncbi:DUF3515 family protein [Microbacterium sp. ARD31]|uniref:DUF3515 family protein n=1 Tax=unclassified Microbacterium TaxID=2609290 RepID=UPI00204119C9|nr:MULTISPECIES: DUF3515 family protein [unclassified Microbacterium]MDT0186359.1 DUF3515 family protein [Microbacterium sp. ARD31]